MEEGGIKKKRERRKKGAEVELSPSLHLTKKEKKKQKKGKEGVGRS